MSVGDNESTATKHAGESMTISIAMVMQRYDARHIARWSTSRASLEATVPPSGKCLRRIAPAAAMVDDFEKTHKTLTKHNF
jgi:hypothetical protein